MEPYRICTMRQRRARLLRHAIIMGGVLLVLSAVQVHADVMTGDQFVMLFSETSPDVIPNVATATLTVDTLSSSPGFFNISAFSVISGDNVCLTCGLLSEDLSQVLFDAATLDLTGNITGTFLGSGGNPHTFTLALTDAPSTTWTFTNVRDFD